MVANAVVSVMALVGLAVLAFVPWFRTDTWRATVTPLASIIGSGFLVVGPILDHTVGTGAVFAMLGLCAAAWLIGDTMRFSIAHVEPLEAQGTLPTPAAATERASRVALAFAYVVSVTYYLNLLGAFALRGFGSVDEAAGRVVASVVIVGIMGVGAWRSLDGLERMELGTVAVKLAMIGALLAGLAYGNVTDWLDGSWALPDLGPHPVDAGVARTMLGLLILVQGFETSRYLGHAYDADQRIRTMRYAQLASGVIYVVFIALLTPWFSTDLSADGGETAIIDMSRQVATFLPAFLVVAALASQFSAAVADTNGCVGLVDEIGGGRVPMPVTYGVMALLALAITWFAPLLTLIAWASRAFAVYYALQGLTALFASGAADVPHRQAWRVWIAMGVALTTAVAVFGVPAG